MKFIAIKRSDVVSKFASGSREQCTNVARANQCYSMNQIRVISALCSSRYHLNSHTHAESLQQHTLQNAMHMMHLLCGLMSSILEIS